MEIPLQTRIWIVLTLLIHAHIGPMTSLLNPQYLEEELKRIGDEALGVGNVQAAYDRLHYQHNQRNGELIVKKISRELSTKIRDLVDPLTTLREQIEINNFDNDADMDTCCHMTNLDFDSVYRAKVNLSKACVVKSSSSTSGRKFPSRSIEEVMIANRKRNKDILWQYFGSVDGSFMIYPAVKITDCDFDPRFRPFYVSGARPKPKDVVLLIDTSNSMNNIHDGTSLLQIAKEAAITVLETLTPNDRVGVVSFNTESNTPGRFSNQEECFKEELAIAIPKNIKEVEAFINRLSAEGKTNYEKALLSAFKYFHMSTKSLQGEDRDQVILFLTDDGYTSGKNPMDVIRDENQKLANRVTVFTFALGNEFGSNSTKLLEDMALQTRSNDSYGQIKIGKYKQILNPSDLKFAMGSYYMDITSSTSPSETVFSTPYIDSFSDIGLISSICQAVYKSGAFSGVVCTDLKISDLLSDITYFQDGELSYAFMVDGYGRTLVHPLLPQPKVMSDTVLLDIRHFERGQEINEVIESMKRGSSGQSTFVSRRIIPRGTILNEGIESREINSTYSWAPVDSYSSNYSVCVVIGKGDRENLLTNLVGNKDDFMYHRRDLAPGPWRSCRHYARFATAEKTSVMFTPSAFEKPHGYLDTPETQALIREYGRYLSGDTNEGLGLKDTIRSTVAVTYNAEQFWKSHPADYAVWRHIVTTDGVVRVYPGIQLEKDWDHKRRPWYWRALSQKGMLVLSAPYKDLWGAGYLVTLTKTIFEGRITGRHSNTDESVAVMAIDLPIHYFYNRMLTLYPECKGEAYRCFLIDNSGIVVMHPDFTEKFTDPQLDETYHIVSKEGPIANDLIAENVLTTRVCTDFENNRDQVTYRVTLPVSKKDGLNKLNTSLGYEIKPITNSNLFLVIKKKFSYIQFECCSKDTYSMCSPKEACGCLCYRDIDFSYCKNEYLSRDASSPCSVSFDNLVSVKFDERARVENLETCFELNCPSRLNKDKCYSIAGCSWCAQTFKGKLLNPACCKLSEECPFGKSIDDEQCSTTNWTSYTTPPNETHMVNKVIVITVSLCSACFVLIIIIIIVVCRRRHPSILSTNGDMVDPYYITAVNAIDAFDNPGMQSRHVPNCSCHEQGKPAYQTKYNESNILYIESTSHYSQIRF